MGRRGWLLLIALGVIWGVPYLLIKVAVAEVSPRGCSPGTDGDRRCRAAALRPAQGRLRRLRGRWPAVLLFAALEIVGPWLLFSDAERTIASSTTGLLVATVPVLAVVVRRLIGDRQPVRAVRWAGLLVGLGGVAILNGPGLTDGHG